MVVSDNICIAVLLLVDLKVGVFPGELLSWINRLTREGHTEIGGRESRSPFITIVSVFLSGVYARQSTESRHIK